MTMEAAVDEEQGKGKVTLPLFDEARRMLEGSYLMFVLPDIRRLIEDNELEGDEDVLKRIVDLPCTGLDVVSIYEKNHERIQEELVKCEDRDDMYLNSIYRDQDALRKVELTAFESGKKEDECVYIVAVNHHFKRINVAFRGSVTKKDFQQDSKALLGGIPCPDLDELKHLPEQLAIHLGFKEYLYGEESLRQALYLPDHAKKFLTGSRSSKREDEENPREKKYRIIMSHVLSYFEQYPEYKLYVMGHSLGGALATIFAFEAACNKDIPKPVTCITSGAPKVGNLDFLWAFEALEEKRHLRCLRVANYRDLVTLSPPAVICSAFCCQQRRFRHVGIRLKLTPHTAMISYPPKVKTYLGIMLFDSLKQVKHLLLVLVLLPLCALFSCRMKKFLRAEHTQLVYMNRFLNQEEFLSKTTLDELYEERFVRGPWRVPVIHVAAKTTAKPEKDDTE